MRRSGQSVAIVGGGVVGLWSALELAEAGCRVTVVSEGEPGEGTSAGNAGMIVPSHVIPLSAPGVIRQGLRWLMRRDAPFHIAPRLDTGLARWLIRFRGHCTAEHVAHAVPILNTLSQHSLEGFEKLHAARPDFAWSKTGLLMLYRSATVRQAVAHEAHAAAAVGQRVKELSRAELSTLDPGLVSEAEGAFLFEDDGRVDPEMLLEGLLNRVGERGVTLRFGLRANRVGPDRVETQRGVLEADHVVIAAGAWTPDLLRGIPIQPAKGYSVTVDAPPGGPRIPAILMDERVTITPMAGKLRFGGTLSLSGFDRSVDPARIRPILQQVERYRPGLDTSRLDVWVGFRPASPDGLPMIGRTAEGVWVNAGHGMMGVSLAPGSAALLADLMLGRKPRMSPEGLDPRRFC